MSIIRDAQTSQDGYDVIGAIEGLQSTCSDLTELLSALQRDMHDLSRQIRHLCDTSQALVDSRQAAADRASERILSQLGEIQEACDGLSVEDMHSLRNQLREMSKITMLSSRKTLTRIADNYTEAIDKAFQRCLRKYIVAITTITAIIAVAILLGEYFVRGLATLLQDDAACVLLCLGVIGLLVWVIIYSVTHRHTG